MRTYQQTKEPDQQIGKENITSNQSQSPTQQQKQQVADNKKINQEVKHSTATMVNQLDPTLQSNYNIDNEFYNSLLG